MWDVGLWGGGRWHPRDVSVTQAIEVMMMRWRGPESEEWRGSGPCVPASRHMAMIAVFIIVEHAGEPV